MWKERDRLNDFFSPDSIVITHDLERKRERERARKRVYLMQIWKSSLPLKYRKRNKIRQNQIIDEETGRGEG